MAEGGSRGTQTEGVFRGVGWNITSFSGRSHMQQAELRIGKEGFETPATCTFRF